jgi:8-oxo-dGTP pyrophosphatase MutT (NUDIX family)
VDVPAATRRAAVVVPIVAAGEPSILFIKRARHLRRNAGQIAFPGGLVDDADGGDLRATALREFHEELGVPAALVDIVGRLPDALVVNRSVLVAPFVGVLATMPPIDVDHDEVESAFAIPIAHVVAPGSLHEGFEAFAGLRIRTWQLDYGDAHVWGATAWILRSLLKEVAGDVTLRAALAARGVAL